MQGILIFLLFKRLLLLDPTPLSFCLLAGLGPVFGPLQLVSRGGVLILISEHFPGKVLLWRKDSGGRIVSLLVSFNDVKYNFVNIYAPTNPTHRKSFF